ncbi:DUF2283 domain-containing protein [Kitasatospora sp. NPDC004745]|uniref:DUF2283 domain-containing protein n=1 Tax=Kitasatospora sp. NPDC004745 TaxID=3364019 RepID=UPI0036C8F9A8
MPSHGRRVRVTYDETANAAYVCLTDPQVGAKSPRMCPCDPVGVDGMINLDFDGQGRLIGTEVLAGRYHASDKPVPRGGQVQPALAALLKAVRGSSGRAYASSAEMAGRAA